MFQQRIKAARVAKGLNQAEAAEALGVSQRYVSKLERGEKKPSVEMLSKLARLYGMSESALLGSEPAIEQGYVVSGGRAASTGLADLAADTALLEALRITPEEWVTLRTIKLPGPTDKAGYVQLLTTIRGISRSVT